MSTEGRFQFFIVPCEDGYVLVDGCPTSGVGYIISRSKRIEDLLPLTGKGLPVWLSSNGQLSLLKS